MNRRLDLESTLQVLKLSQPYYAINNIHVHPKNIKTIRGENLLFADADGATTFEDLVKLEEDLAKMEVDGHGLVCGSRAHLEEESIASRTVLRTILMYGFHACVWIFAVKTVKDTQCGFKVSFN